VAETEVRDEKRKEKASHTLLRWGSDSGWRPVFNLWGFLGLIKFIMEMKNELSSR
jgi:hypothetical protein